jgi:hypothetical protein
MTHNGASDHTVGETENTMNDEELDRLKLIEKDYATRIAAATSEEAKVILEKLQDFVSDEIDHELFDRMRPDELQVADTPTPTPLPFIADFEEASRRRYPVPAANGNQEDKR